MKKILTLLFVFLLVLSTTLFATSIGSVAGSTVAGTTGTLTFETFSGQITTNTTYEKEDAYFTSLNDMGDGGKIEIVTENDETFLRVTQTETSSYTGPFMGINLPIGDYRISITLKLSNSFAIQDDQKFVFRFANESITDTEIKPLYDLAEEGENGWRTITFDKTTTDVYTTCRLLIYATQNSYLDVKEISITQLVETNDNIETEVDTVFNLSDYTIVYGEYEAESLMEANPDLAILTEWDFNRLIAEELNANFKEKFGVELSIVKDTESEPTDKEILIGNTNRKDYQGYLGLTFVRDTVLSNGINMNYVYSATDPFKYAYGLQGNDIYIVGGSYGTTYAASNYFLDYLVENLNNNQTTIASAWKVEGVHDLEVIGCIGDSITQGYRSVSADTGGATTYCYFAYPSYLQRLNWKTSYVYNFGRSGRTMLSTLDNSYQACVRWTEAQNMASVLDKVIIALGTNDSKLVLTNANRDWTDADGKQFIEDFFTIVNTLTETNKDIEFIFSNCPKNYSTENYAKDFILDLQAECVRLAKEKDFNIELFDMQTYSAENMPSATYYHSDKLHPNSKGYHKMATVLDGAYDCTHSFTNYVETGAKIKTATCDNDCGTIDTRLNENLFYFEDANGEFFGYSEGVLLDALENTDSNYQFIGWYNEDLGLYPAGEDLSYIEKTSIITFTPAYVKLVTREGAGVKLTKNKPTGLEFYIETDLEARYIDFVDMHTLIAPTDYIDEVNEFTVENFDAIDKDVLITTYKKNLNFDTEGDFSYYTGSIVNIYQYNYARKFSARGYLTVNYTEGDPVNVYGSFNEENNSRSIYEVALKAYKDRQVAQDDIYANNTGDGYYSRFNNEELKVIKGYIDGVVNITFENGNLSVANPYVDVASGYKTYEEPYTVSINDKKITVSPKAGSDWTFYQGITGKTEYYRVSIIINGIRQIPTNTDQFIVSDSTSNTKDVIGTITVKVILGPGDAGDIFPEDGFFVEDDDPTIDPPVDDYSTFSKDLVFVASSLKGTADGSTPNNATTLNNALGCVKKNDGVIVVTEPINLDEYIDGKYFFPANDKGTTITSVYGGVDYRKTSNASITVSSVVSMYGDYVFEKVDFISGSSNANLCFQYNNVTIGEDIGCTRASGVTNDIALTAGYAVAAGFVMPMYEVSCHEDAKIIIKSGTWQYIRGGNHRNNYNAPFGTIDENATLVIKVEGGTFTATATNLVSAVGMNSVDGTVYMEITGGTFAGNVNLFSRFGSNNTQSYTMHNTGSTTLNIKGGTFNGTAINVYQSDAFTTNTGTNLICIQGGTFANGITVTGSPTANDTLVLGDGITLTNTYFNTIKNGATETAKIVEPTLGYNAPVYTTPPASMNPELGTNFVAKNENGDFIVSDADIDAAIDEIWDTYQNYIEMDLEEGEDLETKFKADLKSRITKIRNLAGLDGVNDALNEFRTLKDTNNEYNLNRVVSSKFITLLTGEYSINKTVTNYGIGGAGGGYMIDCGDFVLVAFGDTEDENGLGSPWRANTLGYTTDFDYTDGIKFDGFYLNDAGEWNGDATEFLNSTHVNNTEMSKIPTGGIKIGNTLYFGYMSVRTWANDENNQGSGSSWQCNYGGLAISRDMGRTWETPADLRWPELSYYAQLYPVLDGDMVYIFGVPGGRNGACKLMRVHKDYIENFAAYEYLVGRDANGNPIYERGYDAMMSDYAIVEKAVGGVGVVWNEYLGEWIMMYASSNTGDIQKASIVMRVAKSLDGVWSDPVVVMSQSTYGAVYEPRICQKYSQGNKLMVICSRWDIYNSLIFEVELEKKN